MRLWKSDLLVDLDADGALGDVPDLAGAAVVELVGHTLVDGPVHLDIDIVADLVGAEVGGQGDVSLLTEGPGEEIPRPRPQPVSRRHLTSRVSALSPLGFLRGGVYI